MREREGSGGRRGEGREWEREKGGGEGRAGNKEERKGGEGREGEGVTTVGMKIIVFV